MEGASTVVDTEAAANAAVQCEGELRRSFALAIDHLNSGNSTAEELRLATGLGLGLLAQSGLGMRSSIELVRTPHFAWTLREA